MCTLTNPLNSTSRPSSKLSPTSHRTTGRAGIVLRGRNVTPMINLVTYWPFYFLEIREGHWRTAEHRLYVVAFI